MGVIVVVYLAAVGVLSVITFLLYGWDKSCARLGKRRVPEKTLHLLSLLGGWPGALLGQQQFRHKTRKMPFQAVFWLTVILHCSAVAAVVVNPDGPATWLRETIRAEDSGPVITPLPRRSNKT